MKIKVPRKIRIGALECRVKFTPYLRSDENWKACLNERTAVIEIDTQLEGNIRDRSFLHEVVHEIEINYECKLGEETTQRLAHGLAEFLFNNLGVELDWGDIE